MKIADHIKDDVRYREFLRTMYEKTGDKGWKDLGDAYKDKIAEDLGLQYRIENAKHKNHDMYYIDENFQYKRSLIRWLDGCKTCGNIKRRKNES